MATSPRRVRPPVGGAVESTGAHFLAAGAADFFAFLGAAAAFFLAILRLVRGEAVRMGAGRRARYKAGVGGRIADQRGRRAREPAADQRERHGG